jgi:hypothetical protein
MRRAPLALAALAWLAAAAVTGELPGADPNLAGHWEGAIATVTGDLLVRVDLERTAEGWRGTLDIPQQGAEGLALAGIEVEPGRVRFALAGVPGEPSFDGALVGGEIRGTFTQTGSRLPFWLGREAVPGPARPQEPRPPFPYRSEEVRVASGDVELAGTLSLPAGPGPFPAIVVLSGSGAQDRDGEILGHRPLLLLADALTRRGVAVLRCDDRGVGGSAGNLGAATTEALAGDALAAVDFLAGRPEVVAGRIGLLGHSEGGLVAALAAAHRPTVAFVVLLATPGVPGRELLPLQVRRLAVAGGASPGVIARQVELIVEGLELLAHESDPLRLRRGLEGVARRQLELFGGGAGASAEALEAALAREVDQLLSPWFRYFVAYDPRPAAAKLRMPVLVVAGELDLQVPPDQNVPALEAALAAAGNTQVTVRRFAGLNHLLQPAATGLPAEYYLLETTLDPAVLALVGEWVAERAAAGVGSP